MDARPLFCSILLFFLLGTCCVSSAAERAVLERLTYTTAADYTRVVITLSREVQHHSFTVPEDPKHDRPPRIVIDLSPVSLGPRVHGPLSVHQGLLLRARTGQFNPTTARVVLDMGRLSEYKVFALYRPFRVIIDVKGGLDLSEESNNKLVPQFRYRIVLDPGHGGRDPGARGINGIKEKEVTLAIARRLATKLRKRLPVKVVLTRDRDVFIPLAKRTALANAAKADLFVSIHANASTNLNLRGVETYYLNNTNDRATTRLAAMENGLGSVTRTVKDGASELSYILSDLIQTGKEEESIALARRIQKSMVGRLQAKYSGVKSLGVKKGPFYVLVGAHMPCVLVETAFLTHRFEGKRLATSAYQEEIAEGLFLGIARFLKDNRVAKSL